MNFNQKLDHAIEKNNSLLCVGLDPDFEKLPESIRNVKNPQFEFNKKIIEATADLVCAFKPNSAFYEARGEQGIRDLKMTCSYINKNYPDIPIILDAKRADIGNTNNEYIKFVFGYLRIDAVTLHPYLGHETIQPFLELKDKGIIVLCKTSNPGAGEIQNLIVNGEKLYKLIARKIVNEWNKNNNCLMVVGATYPEELAEVREISGDMTFLVPGVGAQGGDVEATIKAGLNKAKKGMIINSSRGIIFASSGDDFADVAKKEARKLRDEINKYRV